MRLLVTADLHFNHPRSREGAIELAQQMNARARHEPYDALLLAGDTAVADGGSLEEALSLFDFAGPKLFVPGNHELWSKTADTLELIEATLPRRVADAGWQWLPHEPFKCADGGAVVGSIGWYDYAFAEESIAIPRAFYEAKTSPGAVLATKVPEHLVLLASTMPESQQEIFARWNDAKFVRLPFTDDELVRHECERLHAQLSELGDARTVVVATHTIPFVELMPIRRGGQWDFARAYLGSPQLGEAIRVYRNVSHVLCGHSHWPVEARIGAIDAINIGSGYRMKRFIELLA
jgi:predicted phosphohydrolase